mmetsp:Transcript_15472/g.34582  ORF Transcript_15472/g.34582 Transcript_15472/m.34582 type:complete len:692 (-) Transcript_15472:171-2246(-)
MGISEGMEGEPASRRTARPQEDSEAAGGRGQPWRRRRLLPVGVLLAATCLLVLLSSQGGWGVDAAEKKKDYYKILGVLSSAKKQEIKKAYHKIALKYHPDKNKDKGAEDMFMLISEAYECLSDEEKRRAYDNSGSGGGGPGEEPKKSETSHEPVDMLLKFSGGDFRFKYQPPQEDASNKAPDMVVTVDVELLDLYLGSEFNVSFTRQEICAHCHGSGAAHKHDILACPHCHGSGFRCSVSDRHGEPLGKFWQSMNTTCTKCEGKGEFINSSCPVCGGHKVVLKTVTRSVHVPPGAPDTWTTVLFEEGDQAPGLKHGSVHVGLRVNDHPRFTRKVHDLVYRANISLFEALLGFSLNVTSVDNRSVEIKHDAVSQPGFSKTIRNEGMPVLHAGSYGDLVVAFDIDFPKRLDDAEKELLSSVLDEEEIAKIEQMILRRSIQENLAVLNRPIGHPIMARPGLESFNMVHMIDLALVIPFHGLLTEWSIFALAPGRVTLQVWRPAPRSGEFADHSYSLMGQTAIELDQPGPARLQVQKNEQILCESGDVIGWRVDSDSVLPYDSTDRGMVRITKSPILRAELGRTENFPFSIARTYSIQAVVKSVALLFDDKGCEGERIEVADDSVDFCSLRFITGEFVNGRVMSVLVPPGMRVQFFKECGGSDTVDGPDHDNRANPKAACHQLPLKLSHIKLQRS